MTIPELSRRVFLRRSVQAAGAFLALPGLGAACAPDGEGAAPPGLRVLSPEDHALLAVVADTLVPPGGPFEAGAASVELARHVDAWLADEDPELASGLAGALRLVEWGSPLLAGRLGRFSSLDRSGRSACLEALRDSRLGFAREVFGALKQLCLFVFYAQDASWPATGYDGPWVERKRAPA